MLYLVLTAGGWLMVAFGWPFGFWMGYMLAEKVDRSLLHCHFLYLIPLVSWLAELSECGLVLLFSLQVKRTRADLGRGEDPPLPKQSIQKVRVTKKGHQILFYICNTPHSELLDLPLKEEVNLCQNPLHVGAI